MAIDVRVSMGDFEFCADWNGRTGLVEVDDGIVCAHIPYAVLAALVDAVRSPAGLLNVSVQMDLDETGERVKRERAYEKELEDEANEVPDEGPL